MNVWNGGRLAERLEAEEPSADRRADVLNEFALIAKSDDPLKADGVVPLRGRALKEGGPTHIAILPHGWRVGLSVGGGLPPPLVGRFLRVHACLREVTGELDTDS